MVMPSVAAPFAAPAPQPYNPPWMVFMNNTYIRNSSVEAAPLQDETILLNPANNQFCMLNRTASFIWNRLANAITRDNLAMAICSSYSGVSMEVARADTDRTLEQWLSLRFVATETAKPEGDGVGKKSEVPASMGASTSSLPNYEPPRLTLMKEDEVLSAFQVPVVATTWWG